MFSKHNNDIYTCKSELSLRHQVKFIPTLSKSMIDKIHVVITRRQVVTPTYALCVLWRPTSADLIRWPFTPSTHCQHESFNFYCNI